MRYFGIIEHMFEHVDVTGLDPEQVAEVQRFACLLRVSADAADGAAMAAWQLDRSRVQAVLDGVSLAATAAFESSLVWAADGARSPAAWLAANTATTRPAASIRLKTSRLAAGMVHVSAAARRGDLDAEKVHHLVRARTPETEDAFDAEEARLVATLIPLRVDAAKARLLAWRFEVLERTGRNEPDGPAPTPDSELDRLNLSGGFGGRGLLDADLTPEGRAIVFGTIEAEIDRWFRDGELTDDTRTRSELQGAAFVDIFRRNALTADQHGAPRPLVLALVDADRLAGREPQSSGDDGVALADAPTSGDATAATDNDRQAQLHPAIESLGRRSEIIGIGPVPIETIRRLVCQGDITRIITDGTGRPIDVGRSHRCFTATQWKALIIRSSGTCEWPGCDVTHTRCQAHHLHPWEHGGPTDLTNALVVCTHHHHLLHEGDYTARHARDGTIEIRRPDDTLITTTLRSHAA